MADFKWKDGNANQTGKFQIYKNGSWNDLSNGYGIDGNTNTTFSLVSDFNDSPAAYVTFVTITSNSLNKGVKLMTPGNSVSVDLNTGSSTIEFKAGIMISDDPKVNITWSRSGTATCTLAWNGSSWAFSGDGAPPAGGDTFTVTANQVTIVVINLSANTSSAIYTSDNTANTVGTIAAIQAGGLNKTFSQSEGTSSYIVNIFQPLDTPGQISVK